jgi:hypothetical protein
MRRTRQGISPSKAFLYFSFALLQHLPTLNYLTLRRSPSSYLTFARPTLKILVGKCLGGFFYAPFHAHLALQARPEKVERGQWVRG